jgi:predicted amidohydrolase YtcJ
MRREDRSQEPLVRRHIDGRGLLATPGLINAHQHLSAVAADIACWDLTGVDRIGINDPFAALLFTGLSQLARLVMVNGQIGVEGGLPTQVDPAEAAQQARDLSRAASVG